MSIDSHTHIWVQKPDRYPWSPVGGYVPKNEASLESLLALMDANGVEGAVLVQPTPYGWDNRYLLHSAKQEPKRLRAICLVDPADNNSANEMKKLVEQQDVKGFRFNWHLQPIEEWNKNGNHLKLWSMASKLDCTICIQCTLDYVPLLRKMTEMFPKVKVVVDHIGKPVASLGIQQSIFQQFLSLSEMPNIYLKVSGLYYSSTQPPPFEEVKPFVKSIIHAYGAKRCLWGSDFPFIQDRWSYSSSLEWFNQLEDVSNEDRMWILGGTAKALWW